VNYISRKKLKGETFETTKKIFNFLADIGFLACLEKHMLSNVSISGLIISFTFLSCSVHESKLDETSGDYKQTNKQTQMRSLTPHPSSLSSSALEIFVK